MRYKELPVALRERIFAYFEFKFHNQFFKESDINSMVSPLLRQICHLEDGAHFGEIALIFNEARITSVVAVTACELLILKRSDFLETIQPFPQFKKNLLTLATERMKKTILQS
ncbi:hypothetical protein NQ314_009077 [Rhamnusium bicolor]|uniref:Cyclic nucleotide-binding domain-containing protein n=1 Tax=Rhamnusium bicolor TaxID=1586634 RepID=A0AAV8Y2V6_9CUCU|nr:hypothetical protein NQ314_009077 [Rhamnusium bicolor]